MKRRSSYIYTMIFIMLILLSTLSGCGRTIDGSYILSLKEVKEHNVDALSVEFYNSGNRVDFPTTVLSSSQEEDKINIQSFIDILKKSDKISDDEERIFSPPSQSSHHIEITFDNSLTLEFYYSDENNWLIWSNASELEDKKVMEYYFLSPPQSSMQDWLSAIKPKA